MKPSDINRTSPLRKLQTAPDKGKKYEPKTKRTH